MRILLVDDDEPLMEALASNLIEQRYAVDIAIEGEAALEYVALFNYDLIVLDLILPKTDGISLCKQLRFQGYTMPILMLTARDTSQDKISALDAGADDYVVKPFDFEELTARIRALSRRESQTLQPILHWGNLSLDPKTCEVNYLGKTVNLTPKEYGLLELLLRHPQQVFTPSAIIDNLWSFEDSPSEDAVRTHIKGLRQKLKAAGASRKTIETVYGIGYRLNSQIATVTKIPSPQLATKQKQQKKEENKANVTKAWKQFKEVAQERVFILEQAASALQTSSLDLKLQNQARLTAHKLAGSLGGFGFPEGSKLARKLEDLLQTQLSTETAQIQQFIQLVSSLSKEIEHQPFEETAAQAALVLIVDDNSESSEPLVHAATSCGLRSQITNYSTAQDQIKKISPAVVLLKVSFDNYDRNQLKLLETIHQQQISLPIAVIMEGGDFAHRLQIVRQGASLVWHESTTPEQIMASIAELIRCSGSGAKIMIVDDDPHFLASLELNLSHWNFQLTTLEDPQIFWQVLEKVNPDLLVLDVEMPQISGIELCQVLRADSRWQKLPVLFLTVHQDEKTQHQAFAIGADDYVTKPVLGAELANRILNRLKRTGITKTSS